MTIKNSTLSLNVSPIYTSVGSSAVTTAWFTNVGDITAVINIHAVPAGSTPTANTIVHYNRSITSGDTFILDTEKFILDNGDSIQANTTIDNAVVVTLSTVGI